MKRRSIERVFGLVFAAVVAAAATAPGDASGAVGLGDQDRARRARDAILELDVKAGRSILEGADMTDPAIAIERARLAIYEGDCDAAVTILGRSDVAGRSEGAELGDIARGCARATAATVTVNDDRGVLIRLQDDEDRALVPMLADVALRARAMLAKELGVELPLPLRIELVRDQFTLAAMTGLPEQAAQTTGTVAVAKWGRVTMISPRATQHGFAWLDTLTHELTHLALSRGTRDKAPLWLQEGVAKRQETRWRDHEPLDDFPTVDAIAALGMERGLGLPLDKLGPSIAMLPSAEQAQVAFAEVSSFVRFWAREAGDEALPQLVVRLKDSEGPNPVETAINQVSSADLATWNQRWKAYLATVPKDVPSHLAPGGDIPNMREIAKRVRLGELLHDRGHYRAASIEQARAHTLIPFEPSVRCFLAESLIAMGETANAAPLVEKTEDVHSKYGRFFSLQGLLHPDPQDPDRAFRIGLSLDPLNPFVACQERLGTELPKDPLMAAICEAARRVPR